MRIRPLPTNPRDPCRDGVRPLAFSFILRFISALVVSSLPIEFTRTTLKKSEPYEHSTRFHFITIFGSPFAVFGNRMKNSARAGGGRAGGPAFF